MTRFLGFWAIRKEDKQNDWSGGKTAINYLINTVFCLFCRTNESTLRLDETMIFIMILPPQKKKNKREKKNQFKLEFRLIE